MVLGEELVLGHEAPLANHSKEPQSKVPLRTINCDDCAVWVGRVSRDGEIVHPGQAYYVHANEWVKVMPAVTVMEIMAMGRLQSETMQLADYSKAFDDLCKELSLRVIQWNWTDNFGHPMEQPFHRPDVLALLTADELIWLSNAVSREPAEERKND